jgi:hypothetical protein
MPTVKSVTDIAGLKARQELISAKRAPPEPHGWTTAAWEADALE